MRKIRCPVTRLSATRSWTHERRKSVSFYHACSFTYLFIYFLFERSLHFLQFLPIHSLLFYGIRESSSKKSSSAVFLHLLIRNLEIYKKNYIIRILGFVSTEIEGKTQVYHTTRHLFPTKDRSITTQHARTLNPLKRKETVESKKQPSVRRIIDLLPACKIGWDRSSAETLAESRVKHARADRVGEGESAAQGVGWISILDWVSLESRLITGDSPCRSSMIECVLFLFLLSKRGFDHGWIVFFCIFLLSFFWINIVAIYIYFFALCFLIDWKWFFRTFWEERLVDFGFEEMLYAVGLDEMGFRI